MVRLSQTTLDSINQVFRKHFLHDDELWLFGSRVDEEKKGGDIDLYIETDVADYGIAFEKKISFLCDLKQEIGEQKIDVVLSLRSSNIDLPIYRVAKSEGVRLI